MAKHRSPSLPRMGMSVVRILVQQNDVNANAADKNGQTPLFLAAMNGNEGVLRILVERNDVDPNAPDKDGRTPLRGCSGWE